MAEEYVNKESLAKHIDSRFGEISTPFVVREIRGFPAADVAPKSEVDRLELTLQGVMWSVDKWLDEADYDADPVKRATMMREKTLQIVENAKSKVAREIFEEIYEDCFDQFGYIDYNALAELKKKYTERKEDEGK